MQDMMKKMSKYGMNGMEKMLSNNMVQITWEIC